MGGIGLGAWAGNGWLHCGVSGLFVWHGDVIVKASDRLASDREVVGLTPNRYVIM